MPAQDENEENEEIIENFSQGFNTEEIIENLYQDFNFKCLTFIRHLGNIVYGANNGHYFASGLSLTGHLGLAPAAITAVSHTFPIFSIVSGVLDLLIHAQLIWLDLHPKGLLNISHALSSVFVTGAGIAALALGIPTGCGLLFISLAIRAFLECIAAGNELTNYHKNRLKEESDKVPEAIRKTSWEVEIDIFIELCTRILQFTGWACLALGHPIGWAFLVSTLVPCVAQAGYRRYSMYNKVIFREESENFVPPLETATLRNNPFRT